LSELEANLIGILRIGHETSMRGAGLSLREAIARGCYREIRSSFAPDDLQPLLRHHPALVGEWLAYSEDKRTSSGWYVLATAEIGRVEAGKPVDCQQFPTIEAAVAEFVVRELDFWATFSAR
jgi:hypothetical protein